MEELKSFRPDIFEACKSSVTGMKIDLDFLRVDKEKFESCPAESIDYAVMEKTNIGVVVPFTWNAGNASAVPRFRLIFTECAVHALIISGLCNCPSNTRDAFVRAIFNVDLFLTNRAIAADDTSFRCVTSFDA